MMLSRLAIYEAAKQLLEYLTNIHDLEHTDSAKVRSLYVLIDEARFYFPSGPTQITVIAQNASGGSVTLARQVTVVYTSAVVQVFFRGGEAWMQATVDGTVASGTGRVYAEGETATFTGKTVAIRSGNGAVTNITYNGVYQGTMGSQGQVTEKVYRAQ